MNLFDRIALWLESRACTPAYAGWLLGGIAICFFAAATNTMAGWLYVLSGVILALLGVAAILPVRSLRQLSVRREPISPVSVGDSLTIQLEITNQTNTPKTLLQVLDIVQSELGQLQHTAIEVIEPHQHYRWTYYHPTHKRGIYHWHEVQLRTATPLGLFWCRRSWNAPAKAVVYPTVLPLSRCPIIDEAGSDESIQLSQNYRSRSATEDLTKAIRPYRVGDPTRLIHWRTSARYGELMVRELEVFTGSKEIIIALDSATTWQSQHFEDAVVAAASLYFYAYHRQLQVKLWTPKTGVLHANQVVLEALAATLPLEDAEVDNLPDHPLIWLTQNPVSLNSLSPESRWLLWLSSSLDTKSATGVQPPNSGLVIDPEQPLQPQLQRTVQQEEMRRLGV